MERGDVGLVLGLAGFLLGGWAVFTARSMKPDLDSVMNERRIDEDALTGLGGRVDELDKSHKELTRRVNGLSSDPQQLRQAIERLNVRVDALEKGQAPPKLKDGDPQPPKAATLSQEEFDALRKKIYAGEATDDEEGEFWQMSREHPELLKGILADLEKKVGDAPRDIAARLNLARAYIEKLYTVPDGPEKGVWSMKAVSQWNAVLEIDPNNWDAHQSLGFNYSFWPDQFNKGPDAIKHFEEARKIQEAATPEPKHANTYVQLYKLYVKAGKTTEAKAALDEGLRRFPDDEELKKLR
jgi:tetratricopeptide (TPR) repeat protein